VVFLELIRNNRSKIRILILTENLTIGGQEKHTLRLCRFIDRSRYHVTVGYVGEGPLRADYESLGVPLFNYSKTLKFKGRIWKGRVPWINPNRILSPAKEVARFVRQNNIKIIQTNGIFSYMVGSTASRLTSVPSVRSQPNIMKTDEKRYYKYFKQLPFYRWTCRYIVYARAQKNELFEISVPEKRIYDVGDYGIDINEFNPNVSGMAVRSELGIQPDVPIVGQAARLVKKKRLDFMLRGAQLVIEQEPETVFLIVGDGPEKKHLEKLAQSLGIRQNVIFTGLRLDMPQVTAACDICVFTMENTRGGMVNWEAMASAKPIVCTEGPLKLQSTLIENGSNGILVNSRDVESFAKAIVSLIRDPKKRQRMGTKGRQLCEEQYDFAKTVIPKLQELYEQITGFC
jgi:glycosyltransferase involved in cell wall biosynthesis